MPLRIAPWATYGTTIDCRPLIYTFSEMQQTLLAGALKKRFDPSNAISNVVEVEKDLELSVHPNHPPQQRLVCALSPFKINLTCSYQSRRGATLVYTDGSKDEKSHSGSGALIKDTNGIVKIKKRSPDFSSIFKSELVPIDEGLSYILSSLDPMSIRILSNNRSAIQHLSNWNSVDDKTEDCILNKLKQVSTSCDMHFKWIPSHADGWGSEEAGALAKEGAREALATSNCLTYLKLFCARKHIDKKTWLVPQFILGIKLIPLKDSLL
ncbi:RNase H domain-containing protein [Trichonephila clavipes]|nr:RNase H domain-containing protein [Trichonephila clavipes]